MKRVILGLVIVLISANQVLAGSVYIKQAKGKDEEIIIKQEQQVSGVKTPNYWTDWGSKPPKIDKRNAEPFGRIYVPPHNDEVEYDSAPQREDFKNDPFE